MSDTLPATVNTRISPRGGLDILSRNEVVRLHDASAGGLRDLLRRCALAVLTSGSPAAIASSTLSLEPPPWRRAAMAARC